MKTNNNIYLLFLMFSVFTLKTTALNYPHTSQSIQIVQNNNNSLGKINPFTALGKALKKKVKKLPPVANIIHKTKTKINTIKQITSPHTYTDIKNLKNISPLTHRVVNKLYPAKKNKSRFVTQKTTPVVFQWLEESEFSVEWAHLNFKKHLKYAPSVLATSINKKFLKNSVFYFNFSKGIFQFPYNLKWGVKFSSGLTRNYDIKSLYFIPLSASVVLDFQFFKHQFIIPFIEVGYSIWNINFSNKYSKLFPFWSIGSTISLSLFKHSLRYTLLDEYSINDVGFIIELRNNFNPNRDSKIKPGYFLHSIHAGIYLNL